MYELMVEESFSAAHRLLKCNTPCENLHGHNWLVKVFVQSKELDKEVGWVVDFKELKTALKNILGTFDHQILNDVLPVSPTAENIAKYIYDKLKIIFPGTAKVSIWETERACASYFE